MSTRTSTGVLIEHNDMTRRLDDISERRGPPIRAAVATHQNGRRFFVLIEGSEVIYESERLEDTACHLEIQAMARKAVP